MRTGVVAIAIVATGAHFLASMAMAALPDVGTPGLMETLIRGAEHREATYGALGAICTWDMFYSDRQVQVDRVSSGRQELGARALDVVRFRWSGPKWWMEVLELHSSGWNSWCFLGALPTGPNANDEAKDPPRAMEFCDGTRVWQLDFRQPTAVVRDASGSAAIQGSFKQLAHALLLHVNDKPLSGFLRSLKAPVIEELELIEGTQCYRVVDYRPGKDGVGGYMAAVWIAPEMGFAPVKFEDLFMPGQKREGQRYVRLCARMQEVRPGLWLPTRTTHHTYGYAEDDPDVWRWATAVSVEAWELDVSVEGKCFDTMIPLGANVIGMRRSDAGRYVVGNTDGIMRSFDPDAPPPPIDAARARPLVSTDLKENSWP